MVERVREQRSACRSNREPETRRGEDLRAKEHRSTGLWYCTAKRRQVEWLLGLGDRLAQQEIPPSVMSRRDYLRRCQQPLCFGI